MTGVALALILVACSGATSLPPAGGQGQPDSGNSVLIRASTITVPAAPAVDQAFSTIGREALPTVEVVKILTPSVVQIVTEIQSMDSFNRPTLATGVGTGIILDVAGNILTNHHVVAGAQLITATLSSGDSFQAELVGSDAVTDIAVIRIQADNLHPAKLGISSELQVGQDVIAIGHALGLLGGPTVSKGVVSGLGRSIDTDPQTTMVDLIQTDAAINPGNSGGPLSNAYGEVIGINTAIIRGSQGIGFAINIDAAKLVIDHLLERGYVDRGFLGISPVNLPLALANQLGIPVKQGVLVTRVFPDTAAAQTGIEVEDVIVEMDGEPILNTGELSGFLISHPPGTPISIKLYRGEENLTLRATLGKRPGR